MMMGKISVGRSMMFGASRFMGANFCFSVETEYSEDGACCLFDPRYDLFVFCQPGLWPKPLELPDIWICQKDNDACIGNEHLLYCTSLLFSYDLLSWKAFVSFGIEAERIWHGSQELEDTSFFTHTFYNHDGLDRGTLCFLSVEEKRKTRDKCQQGLTLSQRFRAKDMAR